MLHKIIKICREIKSLKIFRIPRNSQMGGIPGGLALDNKSEISAVYLI